MSSHETDHAQHLKKTTQWLLYFSLSTTLVTEFIITSALCVLLARHRSIFAT